VKQPRQKAPRDHSFRISNSGNWSVFLAGFEAGSQAETRTQLIQAVNLSKTIQSSEN